MEISERKIHDYEKEHWGKSDSVIEKIQIDNLTYSSQMQKSNITKYEAESVFDLLAEAEACGNILKWRKEKAHWIDVSNEKHRVNFIRRRRELVLALEYGNTAEGLLISNILDNNENPISTEVLSNYCDELAILSKEDIERILTGLEEENIIERTKQGWSLLNPVTLPDEDILFRKYSNEFLEKNADFAEFYHSLNETPKILEDIFFAFQIKYAHSVNSLAEYFSQEYEYAQSYSEALEASLYNNDMALKEKHLKSLKEASEYPKRYIKHILHSLEVAGLIIPASDYCIGRPKFNNMFIDFYDDFYFEIAPAFGNDLKSLPKAYLESYYHQKSYEGDY